MLKFPTGHFMLPIQIVGSKPVGTAKIIKRPGLGSRFLPILLPMPPMFAYETYTHIPEMYPAGQIRLRL